MLQSMGHKELDTTERLNCGKKERERNPGSMSKHFYSTYYVQALSEMLYIYLLTILSEPCERML